MQEGVDVEAYKAGTPIPEVEEIRQLDSEVHSAGTIYEQHDAEVKLNDRIAKLSEKTGLSSDAIINQLNQERRLQEEADRVSEELARTKEQWDTIIRTGAKPPEGGKIKVDSGAELPLRDPMLPPSPKVSERFTVASPTPGKSGK